MFLGRERRSSFGREVFIKGVVSCDGFRSGFKVRWLWIIIGVRDGLVIDFVCCVVFFRRGIVFIGLFGIISFF